MHSSSHVLALEGKSTGSVLINIFNETQSSLAASANFGFLLGVRDDED